MEIVSVWGDRVVKMPRAQDVGEMISILARRVGDVKTSSAAENIIRGGGMCIGLGNKICDGRAIVEEGWLVDGEVLLLRVGKGKFTVIQALSGGVAGHSGSRLNVGLVRRRLEIWKP